jgi:hypothetical protein
MAGRWAELSLGVGREWTGAAHAGERKEKGCWASDGPCGERGRGERGPERERREERGAGPLGESRPKGVGLPSFPLLFLFFFHS